MSSKPFDAKYQVPIAMPSRNYKYRHALYQSRQVSRQRSLSSHRTQRALFLWNNEHLVQSSCLSRWIAQAVLPIIYGPLYKNSSGHWNNATVEGLVPNVLKMYMEYDLVLYDKVYGRVLSRRRSQTQIGNAHHEMGIV